MNRGGQQMPEDVERLAMGESLEPGELDARLRALEPLIRRRARLVAYRRGLPPDEFAGEAVSHVGLQLFRGRVDPTRSDRFRSWLDVVLNRLAIDAWRERAGGEQQDPLVDRGDAEGCRLSELVCDPAADEEWLDVERPYLAAEPLPEPDLETLETWTPRERVLVLSLSGWSGRVPDEIWRRWLDAAGFEPPFPPPEVLGCDDLHRRVGLLNAVLADDVAQFWRRKQVRLLELHGWWSLLRENCPAAEAWEPQRLAEVRGWPPLVRIVLLAVSSLWMRLPDWAEWRRWEREAGIGSPLPLPAIVRKARLAQRLNAVQRLLPQRIAADVAAVWAANRERLGRPAAWPFPPRDYEG